MIARTAALVLLLLGLFSTPLLAADAPAREAGTHLTWRFNPERERALRPVIASGEEELRRLAAEIGVAVPDHITVDVADTVEEFFALQYDARAVRTGQAGATLRGEAPEGPQGEKPGQRAPRISAIDWAVGIAYADQGRILLRLDENHLFTLKETFLHELSHVLLLADQPRRPFPRWFSEGLAVHQSGEGLAKRLDPVLGAAVTRQLIPLSSLEQRFPREGPGLNLAYAQSATFVRWLVQQHGGEALRALISEVRGGGVFEARFERIYGASSGALFGTWRRAFEKSASWWRVLSNDMLVWSLVSILFLAALVAKRRQNRKRLREMDAEDRFLDAYHGY